VSVNVQCVDATMHVIKNLLIYLLMCRETVVTSSDLERYSIPAFISGLIVHLKGRGLLLTTPTRLCDKSPVHCTLWLLICDELASFVMGRVAATAASSVSCSCV